jgi:hypothetical protein
MRKYLNPLRVTSALLVFFCAGHTLGALAQTPQFGTASDLVVSAMKSVHVDAMGARCTWWGFYLGFGYDVSIFFAFSAVLTWVLGGLARAEQRRLLPVAWALFLSYALTVPISIAWFFAVPIVFSTAIALLLGYACVRLQWMPE